MNEKETIDSDFDGSHCASSSIDVVIIDGPQHVGRVGSVRLFNSKPFDVKVFGKRLIKVDFADGTSFMAEDCHLEKMKMGCQNCNGTGRAWKICEFTNDPIMADCEGCDGGRLFD